MSEMNRVRKNRMDANCFGGVGETPMEHISCVCVCVCVQGKGEECEERTGIAEERA